MPEGIREAPNIPLYTLMFSNRYDFVITDFSTTAIDCHFCQIPFVIIYDSSRIKYSPYYRQKFKCIDLNLNYKYEYKTILDLGCDNLKKRTDLYQLFKSNNLLKFTN